MRYADYVLYARTEVCPNCSSRCSTPCRDKVGCDYKTRNTIIAELVFTMCVQLPPTVSLLPRPPSTGQPVVINRLRHSSSSAASRKPSLLDVDRRPCIPSPATASVAADPPDCLQKDLLTVGTSTANRMIAHQEHETRETTVNASNSSSTSADSLLTEAESKHVAEKDVKTVDPDAESTTHNLVVDSTEPNVSQHVSQPRIKPVSFCKLLQRAESVIKADPTHSSKQVTSFGRPPPGDTQHQLNDARNKFASAIASAASAEHPAAPTAMKRARARKNSSMLLRSLDSGEARVMSGLLTSLVQSNGSRLASGGHYQLVRSGKNSSSGDVRLPQAPYTKPLAEVS